MAITIEQVKELAAKYIGGQVEVQHHISDDNTSVYRGLVDGLEVQSDRLALTLAWCVTPDPSLRWQSSQNLEWSFILHGVTLTEMSEGRTVFVEFFAGYELYTCAFFPAEHPSNLVLQSAEDGGSTWARLSQDD